jgi:hypothetical protein
LYSGANPATVSYNASAVKIMHYEEKIFSSMYYEKRSIYVGCLLPSTLA